MKFVDLFAPNAFLSKAYSGKIWVYALRWEGKLYVGSSVNLPSRLGWWLTNLAEISVFSAEVAIIKETSTEDRFKEEAFFIKRLNTLHPYGHNKTTSGKAGAVHGRVVSESERQAISRANTGKKRSAEAKLKMRNAKLGGKHTPEHNAKISAALLGQRRTAEQCARISASMMGKAKSPDHRAALCAAWVRRKERNQDTVRRFAFGYGA